MAELFLMLLGFFAVGICICAAAAAALSSFRIRRERKRRRVRKHQIVGFQTTLCCAPLSPDTLVYRAGRSRRAENPKAPEATTVGKDRRNKGGSNMTRNRESPCRNCVRSRRCITTNCARWQRWFSQRWKQTTKRIQEAAQREDIRRFIKSVEQPFHGKALSGAASRGRKGKEKSI